jgi:hypothetical protein
MAENNQWQSDLTFTERYSRILELSVSFSTIIFSVDITERISYIGLIIFIFED